MAKSIKIVKPVRFFLFLILITFMVVTCGSRVKNVVTSVDPQAIYKVVIDPGHGGEDPGATGASGQYEKDFTLSLAKEVKKYLGEESSVEVHMTREDDIFLSAKERLRPKFANDLKADVYISIHGNTFADPSMSGTQTYYYHDYSQSLAEILHQRIVATSGFIDQGVKKEDFFVLTDTNMPAVLLEIGYLTNPTEEEKMSNQDFQKSIAAAIRDGVMEYLETQLNKEKV